MKESEHLKTLRNVCMSSVVAFGLMTIVSGCGNNEINSQPTPKTKGMITPYNQILNPAGILRSYGTPDSEQHAMDCKLSPDGSMLAVEGKFNLVLADTKTKKIVKTIPLGKDYGIYEGVTWSKDSKDIYLTTSTNYKTNIGKILDIKAADANITALFTFQPQNGKPVLPNDIKLSEDGNYMYVTFNGSNEVAKLDIKNKKSVWTQPVAKFPYGIALASQGKLYVTEWGGRNPDQNDSTEGAGWNSVTGNENIVVNPKTSSAASGVVTVLDSDGNILNTINVGLHPNDIISSKNGNRIYVANANSDTVSVIDATNNKLIETISVSPNKLPFGCSPTALVLSPDENYLYVADSMINAVAVIKLGNVSVGYSTEDDGDADDASKIAGFIPTGAYPGGLDISKDGQVLYAADTEGMLSTVTTNDTNDTHYTLYTGPNKGKVSTAGNYNTHRELGYFSIINIPDKDGLDKYTKTALDDINFDRVVKNMATAAQPARKDIAAKPIPERLGEPSVFKHVIYIIKENRSYDQVFGDMKEGNGLSKLTVFGEKVTPNEHKFAKDFFLLDNYYTPSKCSGSGHPWADSAYITDFVEKNVRTWLRGYYHVILDAMVAPKTGYIWDNVLNHGETFRNYGENLVPSGADKNVSSWTEVYNDYKSGTSIDFESNGTIKSLVKYSSKHYPAYNGHKIPDVLRAQKFIDELKNGTPLANFTIMALPDDHTAGTKAGHPTPSAMVADNDLALGQIVEAVSKSKYWKDTIIFVTEDDAQNGWDHVSAYRTPGFVISPYSRLHKTIHTYYSTLSMIHTMEQILGIPPMNIYDASAPLMYDCFTDKPDLTPYTHVKNNIPLDTMNPATRSLSGSARYWSEVANGMSDDLDDDANDEPLNRMIWYSVKGYDTPYPEKYVLPADDEDDD